MDTKYPLEDAFLLAAVSRKVWSPDVATVTPVIVADSTSVKDEYRSIGDPTFTPSMLAVTIPDAPPLAKASFTLHVPAAPSHVYSLQSPAALPVVGYTLVKSEPVSGIITGLKACTLDSLPDVAEGMV